MCFTCRWEPDRRVGLRVGLGALTHLVKPEPEVSLRLAWGCGILPHRRFLRKKTVLVCIWRCS